jgi:hypothetical protein
MIKNSFLMCVMLLAGISIASAQSGVQDIIYLKDGSMFRGIIKEQYPDSLVKIEIAGGNVIAIGAAELDYIDYKVKNTARLSTPVQKVEVAGHKDHGYFNVTEMGVLPGVNYNYDFYYGSQYSETSVGFTVQTIHGYRFNPHFLAGAGLAIDIIQQPMGQLFADGRWEILKRKATPFVFADLGYGIPLSQGPDDDFSQTTYKGGITAGAGVGMRISFREEGAFLMEVGYKLDKRSEHIVSDWWGDKTNEYTYNRLAIRFGLAF